MATQYYMLVASLPHLPHFLKAERLPLNPQRLRWRRSSLEALDAADLEMAISLLHAPRHPRARSDAQIDAQFRRAMDRIRSERLREFVDRTMGERSVLAALRRKALQLPAPKDGERCGVGRWDGLIRGRWDREDFGIAPLFPWIPQAKSLLAQGQAVDLEKLLMEAMWRRASQIAEADPFGFPAVFAYVFKWDVLTRWLSHNADRAAQRFKQLIDEVIHEQQASPAPGRSDARETELVGAQGA
jgi:hypothetical protein